MIDRLGFLLALAQERHFGRAAAACGVSQQSLSAALKQLEERLGVLLVHRGSRFQGFTPEGERVLDWARRIVGDADAMQQEVRALKQGLAGHLRLAAIPTALPMVERLTAPYRDRFPGVRFTIRSATSSEILSQLANLEIEAGLTYLGNERLGRVTATPLYMERYCLLVPPGHAMAGRAGVTWAEAAGLPLCLLTPDMQNRRIVEQQLRSAGVDPQPEVESNSLLVLVTHVRSGRWASIVPAIVAEAAGALGSVVAIPLVDPVITHQIGLVVPQREPMLPIVAALVRVATAAVDNGFLSHH